MNRPLALGALLLATTAPALAQNSKPQPVPIVDKVPAARDVQYPGTLKLEIDATNVAQGIFTVKETIPVAKAGPMILLFPEWLPGAHAPRGQIEKLTGLVFTGNGKVIPWKRDVLDMNAFHLDIPAGVRSVEARFQFASATQGNQGRIVMAPKMLNLQPNSMSLYPAGYFTRNIPVSMTVTYPDGWTARSGLPATNRGSVYSYQTTDYDTLVDSPVFAGAYFKEWALSDRVDLNVFADNPKELEAKPEHIEAHKRLVEQGVKLFGAQHYDKYEFLFAITDEMGGIGLEHHRSSENGVGPGYFTEWDKGPGSRNLLPHEYTHSWNGKFRRGADLWTPDFRYPMRDSLLWVYEGQTQFWGYVLQARSGIVGKQDTLDMLANIAATLDTRAGRTWRPLIDTTNDPIISARRPKGWTSWQRSEDYYNEGLLIWLEVDAKLRELSGSTKSMDDFAKAFFGINDGDWGVVTYTFDDVVRILNGIQPFDWAKHLKARTELVSQGAPLGGFTGNGYKLVYSEEPTAFLKGSEAKAGGVNLTYSLGLTIGKDGTISGVDWGSPAFKAGLAVGGTVTAVGGEAYTPDQLKTAVKAAKGGREPIRLLVKYGTHFREAAIDYHDGLRYPRLEKTGAGENGLDRLLSAK
ncbi:M61 family metallopeptidase [Sphingomonas sp. FW199]|uniref:M61 family metallopeptidase n=1 Tax=Sphingomonas sp. FW199 TaxID=3400217 RepID=UPI003CEEA840